MKRMLSNTYTDNSPQSCPRGCCTIRGLYIHGGRRDPRIRPWTRAADKRSWRRDDDKY